MALTDTFIEKQITLDLSQAGLGFSIIGGTDEPLEDGKGRTLLPKVISWKRLAPVSLTRLCAPSTVNMLLS